MHENVLFSVRDIQKLKFSGSNRRSREGKDDMEFFKIREFFGFKIFHPKLTSLAESFNHTLIESLSLVTIRHRNASTVVGQLGWFLLLLGDHGHLG